MTANEDYLKTTLEKLEVDNKLKCQQFGSHIEGSPERDPSPAPKPSPRIIRKTDEETFSNKGDTRSSLLATTRKFKTSVSFTIAMGANSNRTSELTEPNLRKDWQCVQSKACCFLEEDGEIISHQYRMQIAQRSMVYLTIKPLNLSQVEGKPSQWLLVDTALYILFFSPSSIFYPPTQTCSAASFPTLPQSSCWVKTVTARSLGEPLCKVTTGTEPFAGRCFFPLWHPCALLHVLLVPHDLKEVNDHQPQRQSHARKPNEGPMAKLGPKGGTHAVHVRTWTPG